MKATGIVRRIDDLGRVVIPKEIRRTLRIREADSLEIYTDREGEIILKKYSPIAEMAEIAKQYVDVLAQTSGQIVAVTDCEQFIVVSANGRKELQQKPIHKELETAIFNRERITASVSSKEFIRISDDNASYAQEIVCPIISQGDAIGSVVLLSKDNSKSIWVSEEGLVSFTANMLGKQLEQ